jgi:hypothetical protein
MSGSSTARLRRILRPFRGHSQSFRAQLKRLLRANATGYAVTLAAAPILSRIYSPAAFGAFGLFLAFLSLTGGLGGMRYEAGILSARDRAEARELAMLAMLSAVLLGAITRSPFRGSSCWTCSRRAGCQPGRPPRFCSASSSPSATPRSDTRCTTSGTPQPWRVA